MKKLISIVLFINIIVWAQPAYTTGMPVIDVANLWENLKQGYQEVRAQMVRLRKLLYQINSIRNEIEMIKNQGKYLINQAKNLDSLDFDDVQGFVDGFFEFDDLVNRTDNVAGRSARMEEAIRNLFPNYDTTGIEGSDHKRVAQVKKNRETIGTSVAVSRLIKDRNKADAERLKRFLGAAKKADGNLAIQQAIAQLNGEMLAYMGQMKNLQAQILEQQSLLVQRAEQRDIDRMRRNKQLMSDIKPKTNGSKYVSFPKLH